MDSVPRIQGAFAPLFLEEWGHGVRGVDYLWRGLDEGRSISESMNVHTQLHVSVCMSVVGIHLCMQASSSLGPHLCTHVHIIICKSSSLGLPCTSMYIHIPVVDDG